MYNSKMRADIPTEYNPYTHSFGAPGFQRTQIRQPMRYEKKKKSRKRFYGLIAVVIILGLVFFMRPGTTQQSETKVLSATKNNTNSSFNIDAAANNTTDKSEQPVLNESVKTYSSLEDAVNTALLDSKGDYGIVIKNLKTGEIYQRQQDKEYEPGSLYKLWVMAAVYEQISKGELSEDQELSRSIAFLNSSFGISPENAEQTQGTISLTVNEALNQMITISHNYSALLLSEKIKLSTVKAYLAANGFNSSRVGSAEAEPMTTPADIALFLEKLYNQKLVSPEYSNKMLDLMKKQEKNNKLPLYLPSGVEMAHKTGELGMFSHDAGIVYTPKGNYIIVAFSETESPKGAEDRIGRVSQAVYEYFTNK